jgi:HK97 family phage major capsid protein
MSDKTVSIKSMTDDAIVVAGYGVVWGDRDLYGDTFTPETDLGIKYHPNPPAYYDHTLSGVETEIGITVKMAPDAVGLWVEQELDRHHEYMEGITKLIEAGALGYSTGAPGHLIRAERTVITKWPIVDVSLTPTPAEPRTLGVQRLRAIAQAHPELKAFLPQVDGESTADGATAEPEPNPITNSGGVAMTEPTQTVDVAAIAREAADAAVKAYQTQLAAEESTLRGLAAIAPAEPRDPNDHGPFKNFAEQMLAIKAAGMEGAPRDERLFAVKASGLNEGVSSEGGYLVQQDFAREILRKTYDQGQILSRVRRIPIGPNANGLKVNAIDETSRATGSRWGGVQVYFACEAGTASATKPKFRQVEWNLKKIMGFWYATDEVQQDTTSMSDIVTEAFSQEFTYTLEDEIFRGIGGGHFHGILSNGGLVSVTKETGQAADTFTYKNALSMWSRLWARSRSNAVWFINQDVEPQLYQMNMPIGTGGVPVFLPPGGASTSQYSTLFGRPIIPVEQADTVGDKGDVILADLSQYVMIEKGGLQTAVSMHVKFMNDEDVFRFIYRADGMSPWNSPLTPANSSNTLSPFITLDPRA